MSILAIPSAVYSELRSHGEESYPDECCGALLGVLSSEGWQVVKAVRAVNAQTDAAHDRYSISPLELVHIARQAREDGLEIAGFYHSHPDHPAQWSRTDFVEAHWLGCAYVITEVDRGKAVVTNCFLLAGENEEQKQFQQLLIDIQD